MERDPLKTAQVFSSLRLGMILLPMTPISSNFSMVTESGILLGDSLLGGRTHQQVTVQHWCNNHALSVDRGNHEQDVIIDRVPFRPFKDAILASPGGERKLSVSHHFRDHVSVAANCVDDKVAKRSRCSR